MSITTSREERDQAQAHAKAETTAQLEKDLAYWACAKVDHHGAWLTLTEQRARVQEMYGEADAWVDLISAELHRRRVEERL